MRSRSLAAPLAASLAVALAACGSSSSSGSDGSAGPSSTPNRSGSNAPNPNAPETNPAGDIPDNQVYVRYHPPGERFSLKIPEGWSRSATTGGVRFTDKLNTVAIRSQPASTTPSVAEAKRESAQLARSVQGFKLQSVSIVRRTSGRAIRTRYLATAATNPVTGKRGTDAVERYVFFHSGRAAILTLSGPKGADNVDPWRIVTDSLRWR
jgi:hypothetical protein